MSRSSQSLLAQVSVEQCSSPLAALSHWWKFHIAMVMISHCIGHPLLTENKIILINPGGVVVEKYIYV